MAFQAFRAGGFVTDNPADILALWGKIATSGNVTHLRQAHTTTGYQVTAGKTLYLVRLYITSTITNISSIKLGYADNDVGLDTATARTNGVMALGLDDTAENGLYPNQALPSITPVAVYDLQWKLAAAQKFPFIRALISGGQFTFLAWCVER